MAFFDNENVRLFYNLESGPGPLVVLINGHTRSCSDFKQFVSFLKSKSCSVLCFDNRGSGQTQSALDFSLEDIADDLKKLLVHLALDQCHLVGFSMGGVIARIFGHKYSKFVKSLSLVSTPLEPVFFSKAERSWGKTEEDILGKLKDYVSRGFFVRNELLMKAMAKGIYRQLAGGFLEKSLVQKKASLLTDKEFFHLGSFSFPLLLVHGDQDNVISLNDGKALEMQNERAKLVVIEEAGHLLLMEKPQTLFKTVEAFLDI